MKLPALQPVRTGTADLDRFLEAVKERLEIREGSRGDLGEKTVLRKELESLGLVTRQRVALPDGKPGYVTQLTDGTFKAISADELLRRLGLTGGASSTPSYGLSARDKAEIMAAIAEEITKRGAGDVRLDGLIAALRDQLLRRIGDLAARLGTTLPPSAVPPVFDEFEVSTLADGTRVLTWAYTTTTPPAGYEGAMVRWEFYGASAYGTETWDDMTGYYDGLLTQSPFEYRGGAAGKYRFAIKSRAFGVLSSDTLYFNVDLPDLSTTPDLSLSYPGVIFLVSGASTDPTDITLTANLTGGLTGTVTWSHGSGTFGGTVPTGTNTWTVAGTDFSQDSMTFTASLTVGATTYTDTVTLYRIVQGSDTIVPVLTNPYISVAADSAGEVASFTPAKTGIMQVYYGGALQTSGLTFSVQADPDGTDVTISNTSGATYGEYTLAFPGTPSGWWLSGSAEANVTLRAALTANPAAYRDIVLVVSKALAGSDGTDFESIFLAANTRTMSFDSAGAAYPAAQTATLSVSRQPTALAGTVSFAATAYDASGTSQGSVTLTGSGDSRSLSSTNFMAPGGVFDNDVQYVDIVATLGSLSSQVRVVRLTDGAEPIISGLTKPSVTLAADSSGTVSSYTAAQHSASAPQNFTIVQGASTLGSGVTYSTVGFTGASAISGPYASSATINPTTGEYGVSSITWGSGDTVQITYRATHTSGVYRDAVFTITRSRAGATGSDAQVITLSANNSQFGFTTAGVEYPSSGQSATFTVTRNPTSLAGTVTWSAIARTATGTTVSDISASLTGSGDSRSLTAAAFIAPGNTVQYVEITATLGSLTPKTLRLLRITDGQEPYLSILTTGQAVSVPADATGAVTSWTAAAGSLQLFQGGTQITSGLTYSIQANPSTLTATMNSSTGAFAVTGAGSWSSSSNQTTITFRVAVTATPSVYRDVVLTITKQIGGLDGISYEFANPSHSVPSDSSGNVSSYTGSGTTIRVLEGSTYLTYHSTTLAASRFTIGTPTISPGAAITSGSITGSGTTTATVGVHSGMSAAQDVVTITYPLTIRRANGTDVSISLIQTITKSKAGSTGGTGQRGSLSFTATSASYTSTYNNGAGAGAASYKAQATTLIASAASGLTPTTPIKGDTITFTNGSNYTTTYQCDGTYATNGNNSWSVLTMVIDGSLIVTGTLDVSALKAGTRSGSNGAFSLDTNAGYGNTLLTLTRAASNSATMVTFWDTYTGGSSNGYALQVGSERSGVLHVIAPSGNNYDQAVRFADANFATRTNDFVYILGKVTIASGDLKYDGVTITRPGAYNSKAYYLLSDGTWGYVAGGIGSTTVAAATLTTKPGSYSGANIWGLMDINGTRYTWPMWQYNT